MPQLRIAEDVDHDGDEPHHATGSSVARRAARVNPIVALSHH
jgi:hypothetical protein